MHIAANGRNEPQDLIAFNSKVLGAVLPNPTLCGLASAALQDFDITAVTTGPAYKCERLNRTVQFIPFLGLRRVGEEPILGLGLLSRDGDISTLEAITGANAVRQPSLVFAPLPDEIGSEVAYAAVMQFSAQRVQTGSVIQRMVDQAVQGKIQPATDTDRVSSLCRTLEQFGFSISGVTKVPELESPAVVAQPPSEEMAPVTAPEIPQVQPLAAESMPAWEPAEFPDLVAKADFRGLLTSRTLWLTVLLDDFRSTYMNRSERAVTFFEFAKKFGIVMSRCGVGLYKSIDTLVGSFDEGAIVFKSQTRQQELQELVSKLPAISEYFEFLTSNHETPWKINRMARADFEACYAIVRKCHQHACDEIRGGQRAEDAEVFPFIQACETTLSQIGLLARRYLAEFYDLVEAPE